MKEIIIDKIAIAMRRKKETISSITNKTGLAFNTVSKIVNTGSGNIENIEKILDYLNIEIK